MAQIWVIFQNYRDFFKIGSLIEKNKKNPISNFLASFSVGIVSNKLGKPIDHFPKVSRQMEYSIPLIHSRKTRTHRKKAVNSWKMTQIWGISQKYSDFFKIGSLVEKIKKSDVEVFCFFFGRNSAKQIGQTHRSFSRSFAPNGIFNTPYPFAKNYDT